jgi:hypothetical protein
MYIASSHTQTATTFVWNLIATSVLNPISIISCTKTAAPPTSAAVGATVTSTSTVSGSGDYGAGTCGAYIYGLALNAAGFLFSFGVSNNTIHYESCTFTLNMPNSTAASYQFFTSASGSSNLYRFTNCTWALNAHVDSGFAGSNANAQSVDIIGGSITSGATSALNHLFGPSNSTCPANMTLRGVDMSGLHANTVLSSTSSFNQKIWLIDCALPSGYSAPTSWSTDAQQAEFFILRSDSSGNNYNSYKASNFGWQAVDTQLVRTGGATDGTTLISWKLNPATIYVTANPQGGFAFRCNPLLMWNSITSQNVTVTAYGIWKGAAVPNNCDIDIEVEYLGSSGSPLGTLKNSNRVDPLTASTPLSADTTSDWSSGITAWQSAHAYGAFTGFIKAGNASPQQVWFMSSHSGTGTSGSDSTIFNGKADGATVTDNSGGNQIIWQAMTRFSMAVICTSPQPQLAGALYTRIRAWLANVIFWVDPLPVKSPAN